MVKGIPIDDLTGQRFGRLTIIGPGERSSQDRFRWGCLCDCGSKVNVHGRYLKTGKTTSCGCFRVDHCRSISIEHGQSRTTEHVIWMDMVARCSRPSHQAYRHYGGRGISVCQRWADSFESFFADMGPRPEGLTIDRKDNNGNYELGNCRWATMKQQNRNRRNNRIVSINGEDMPLVDAAEKFGIPYRKAHARLYRGWTIEQALEISNG